MSLLELNDVSVHYGRIQALHGLTFTVEEGEVVSLIGANGAGKTTTMKTISGLLSPSSGNIMFQGEDITKVKPHLRPGLGICQAPEGRGVFPGMTVRENLGMGAFGRKDKAGIDEDYDRVFELFPRLKERENQLGGTMSGGEQQMVAVARALMSAPRLLMLDEPSLGLAPRMVDELLAIVARLPRPAARVVTIERHQRVKIGLRYRANINRDRGRRAGAPRVGALARHRPYSKPSFALSS